MINWSFWSWETPIWFDSSVKETSIALWVPLVGAGISDIDAVESVVKNVKLDRFNVVCWGVEVIELISGVPTSVDICFFFNFVISSSSFLTLFLSFLFRKKSFSAAFIFTVSSLSSNLVSRFDFLGGLFCFDGFLCSWRFGGFGWKFWCSFRFFNNFS